MSDITPPNRLRPDRPTAPSRDVKRVARMRDHQDDDRTAPVGPHHEEGGHGQSDRDADPAVVVSHPAAHVSPGERLVGEVVEVTPQQQPVLQSGGLKLLIDRALPLESETRVSLTVVETEPLVKARIEAIADSPMPADFIVSILVLAAGDDGALESGRPATYAAPPAAVRARLMREQTND